jgi:hypothetical protein
MKKIFEQKAANGAKAWGRVAGGCGGLALEVRGAVSETPDRNRRERRRF